MKLLFQAYCSSKKSIELGVRRLESEFLPLFTRHSFMLKAPLYFFSIVFIVIVIK